jgi:hypothetical protein
VTFGTIVLLDRRVVRRRRARRAPRAWEQRLVLSTWTVLPFKEAKGGRRRRSNSSNGRSDPRLNRVDVLLADVAAGIDSTRRDAGGAEIAFRELRVRLPNARGNSKNCGSDLGKSQRC